VIRISKAGRPRKRNVKRDDKGKSRGEIFDPSVIWAQPHRREVSDPSSERAAYPLGRLRLNELITEPQLRAGNEFAAVVYAYARTMGIPMGSPRSGSMSECIATGFYSWESEQRQVDPEEEAKRVQRVKGRYNDVVEALAEVGRTLNRDLLRVMKRYCIEEMDEQALWRDGDEMGNLRSGLNVADRILVERRG